MSGEGVRVIRMTEAEARAVVARVDERFPDFDAIFRMDLDSCCRLDEVADRYGWGDATDAWEEYDSTRWLLGDR